LINGWFNTTDGNGTNGFCEEKSNCTQGTYLNETENTCFLCPIHCAACAYNETNIVMNNITCSSCDDDAFFNTTYFSCDMKSICNEGTFYNKTDNWCYDCPETCSDCVYDELNLNNSNVTCFGCELESFYNNINKSCDIVPLCEHGVYYNETTNLCDSCPEGCNNCTVNASDIEHNGLTCFGCEEKFWFNPKKGNCTPRANCEGNTYYNETEETCFFCPYYCAECNFDDTNPDYNNITCLSCIDDGFFNSTLGSCEIKSQCHNGTFYNPINNSCYDCADDCATCGFDIKNSKNNFEKCTKCEDELHYKLNGDGKCISKHD